MIARPEAPRSRDLAVLLLSLKPSHCQAACSDRGDAVSFFARVRRWLATAVVLFVAVFAIFTFWLAISSPTPPTRPVAPVVPTVPLSFVSRVTSVPAGSGIAVDEVKLDRRYGMLSVRFHAPRHGPWAMTASIWMRDRRGNQVGWRHHWEAPRSWTCDGMTVTHSDNTGLRWVASCRIPSPHDETSRWDAGELVPDVTITRAEVVHEPHSGQAQGPAHRGPNCVRGCPCGNSCIPCSHRCTH